MFECGYACICVHVSVSLAFYFPFYFCILLFCFYFCLILIFLKRDRDSQLARLDVWGAREDLEGTKGEETMVKIYEEMFSIENNLWSKLGTNEFPKKGKNRERQSRL